MGLSFLFLLALIAGFCAPVIIIGPIIGSVLGWKRAWVIIPLGLSCGLYVIFLFLALGSFRMITGRDSGFGDDYLLNLGNGYCFEATVSLNDASVYRFVSNERMSDNLVSFSNVRLLQQSGNWLAGNSEGEWFLVNTASDQCLIAKSQTELAKLANQKGFELNLVSVTNFYNSHQRGWEDWILIGLLMTIPFVLFYVLRQILGHCPKPCITP